MFGDHPTRDDPSDEQGDRSDDDDEGNDASESEHHLDVTAEESGAKLEDSSASADSVIAESLHESMEAADQWIFEKTLEFMADVVHPGAGRLIGIALKLKELLGDAEALASPDSPRNLHVPLLDVTSGLTVDLSATRFRKPRRVVAALSARQ
jgi:hypothetical protein